MGLETLALHARSPYDVLEQAHREHGPIIKTIALTSGGQDSTAAMLAVKDSLDYAVHIDTGTALPGVREHVERVCSTLGVPLRVYETPWSEYESMVLKYGFPGPAQHRTSYIRLKERRVLEAMRDIPRKRGERVILVTGVRQLESTRRMGTTSAINRNGSQVWVAPIIDWDKRQVVDACETAGIAPSDVTALVHRSGECNCGAFASPGEREMIEALFPEWWERIAGLERKARANGVPCVWGARPENKSISQILSVEGTQQLWTGPMCHGCDQRAMGEGR